MRADRGYAKWLPYSLERDVIVARCFGVIMNLSAIADITF